MNALCMFRVFYLMYLPLNITIGGQVKDMILEFCEKSRLLFRKDRTAEASYKIFF